MTFNFTGSLPDARLTARSCALWTVKLPLICALPPRIGSLMFGADSTLSSRMMGNGLPTFFCGGGAAVLIELLRRVGQLVAGDHDAALDRDRSGAVGHWQDLAARRRAPLLD